MKRALLLSEEEEQEIIKKYKDGMTGYMLADQYYCSSGTIYNVLKRHNITSEEKRGRTRFPKHIKAMIINDWNANITTEEIAEKYKLTRYQVRNAITYWRRMGLYVAKREKGNIKDSARRIKR